MAAFAARANDAAKALSTTTTRYTDAALIYYQQGLSDEEVEARTNTTIKMANAAGESAQEVSDQLTAIWNNFYDGSKSLEYYADVMTKLGAETASSTSEISEGINKFAAVADTVGLSYEYAAAALATVTATTRESADVVGNAYKTLFARIQGLSLGETLEDGTNLNKYSKALDAVGISIFEQNGQLKEMDDVLDELGSKWTLISKDQQVALAETVAGVRQYTQLIALMDNWDYFQENLQRAYSAEGSLQKQADIYADNWEAASTRVRAAWEGIYSALLDDDVFIKYNEVIASVLHGVEGLVDSFGGLGGIVQAVGGLALQVFAKNIPSAIESLRGTLSFITGKSREETAKIQQEAVEALKNSRGLDTSAEYEMQRAGLEKVAQMKHELTVMSKDLTAAEEEEFRVRIQQTESIATTLAALGQQIDQQNAKLKGSVSEFTNNSISGLAELQAQMSKTGDGWEDKWEDLISDVLPVLGEELHDLSGIDPFLGVAQKTAKAGEQYKKITDYVRDLSASLTENLVIRNRYLQTQDSIDNQVNSWKDLNEITQANKDSMTEYLQKLRQVVNTDNMQGFFNWDDNSYNNLIAKLSSADVSTDELKKSVEDFFNTLNQRSADGKVDRSFERLGTTINELEIKFRKLMQAFYMSKGESEQSAIEKATKDARNLVKEFDEYAATVLKGRDALVQFVDMNGHVVKDMPKVSEILAQTAGQMMSISSAATMVVNGFKNLTDESASFGEKMGSLVSALGGTVTLFSSITNNGKVAFRTFNNLKNGATGAAAAINSLQLACAVANIALAAISTGIQIYTAYQQKMYENAQKSAEAAREQADAMKELAEQNSGLITSMESLLEQYRSTGEGKDALDDATRKLAEAYGVEGSALAELSGQYENYQAVLDAAKQKQREELEGQIPQLQTDQSIQGNFLLQQARQGRGRKYSNGDEQRYFLNFDRNNLGGGNKATDQAILDAFAQNGLQRSFQIDTTFDEASIVELYDKLQGVVNDLYNVEGVSQNSVYSSITEWLGKMQETVEAYRQYSTEIGQIQAELGVSDANVKNLQDYTELREHLIDTLDKEKLSEQERAKIVDAALASSTDASIRNMQTVERALQEIESSGTKVSQETLEKIWTSVAKGEDVYNSAALATLDWGNLTDETWEKAYNAAIKYNDEVTKLQNITVTKTQATGLLDDYYKKDEGELTSDQLREIQAAFPWGDAEKQIISFNDFLEKSYEDQKAYLQSIADFSIIPQLEAQIDTAKQKIQELRDEKQKAQEEFSNSWITIDTRALTSGVTDASIEKFFNDNRQLFKNGGYENGEVFAEAFMSAYQRSGNDIKKALEKIKPQLNTSDIDKQIDSLEKTIDDLNLEIKLQPDTRSVEQLIDSVEKSLEHLGQISISADTSDFFATVADIMDEDYSISIKIQEELDQNLQEAVAQIDAINEAASRIGENFLISAEDVQVLADTFPGILDGYSVTTAGMIQLNGEVAEVAVKNAQAEANAEYEKNYEKLVAERDYVKEKLDAYKGIQEKLNEYLKTEITDEEKATNLKGEIQEDLTKVINIQNEKRNDSNEEVELNGIESFENLANAGEYNYEYIGSSADIVYQSMEKYANSSVFSQLSALMDLAKGFEAAKQGDIPALNAIIKKYKSLVKDNKNLLTDRFIEDYDTFFEGLLGDNLDITYDKEKDEYVGVNPETGNTVVSDETARELQRLVDNVSTNVEYYEGLYDELVTAADEYSAYTAAINQNITNRAEGLGDVSKSSSKTKEEKEEEIKEEKLITKELEDRADVYEYINNQLEYTNDLLDRQEEITSNAKSYEEKVESLREEEKILENLNDLYAKKAELSEDELAKARENLTQTISGVEFDDTGLVSNVYDLRQSITDKLNDKIKEFNAATTEAEQDVLETEIDAIEKERDLWDKLLDDYQEQWDNVQQLLSLRQSTYYDKINKSLEIQFLKKDIKTLDEIQAENYEWLNNTLEVELNINQRDLDMIDYYLSKLEDDFYSMAEAAELIVSKIPHYESNMENYENFFNSLQEQFQTGDISAEDYLEGLDKAYKGIMDNLEALNELDKKMMHYYEDTLSAATKELDYYNDSLEHLTSVLEHYKDIVELVDGDYNFDAIDTILRGQATTRQNEIDALKAEYEMLLRQKETIEGQMASVEAGSSAWELFNNELQAITKAVNDAEDEMLQKTQEWAETMKAIMQNTFDQAAYEMERNMTNGMGFDRLNDSLDRLKEYQDIYLTTTNEMYELEKLMNNARAAADKTQNAAAKQKLKSYMDEIDVLKNDGLPLSKLELEIQQARFDLLQAEIALEEAQNAKAKVRLQRDNEGNYGYVYTADQDAVSSAEADLAAAENALYNIGLDATNEYGQKLLELQQQLSDDLIQLEKDRADGRFATEAEYEAAKEQLIREYNDLFTAYYDQYTTALGVDLNIQEDAWITAYDSMIDKTQDWQMYTTQYTNECENAYNQWRDAVAQNNEIIQDVLTNTKEKVKEVTDASNELKQEVVGSVIPAIESELDAVLEITAAYAAQRDQIRDLISYYEQLLDRIRELAAEQSRAQVEKFDVYADDYSIAMGQYLRGDTSHSINDAYYQALVKARNEKMQEDPYTQYEETAEDFYTLLYKYQQYHSQGVENELTKYVDKILDGNGYWDYPTIYDLLARFNTGGYTGMWPGNYGKLAVLDKKELVLNADDTELFLDAAKIMRSVASLINTQTAQSQAASIITTQSTLGTTQSFNQNVHIEASFPSVTDRVEIEEAFNNLINTASQYANRKAI